MRSRDEHHVHHELEEKFNSLHGLVGNISSSNFEDFQLPKSPSRNPTVETSKEKPAKGKTSSPNAASDASALAGPSSTTLATSGSQNICQFCDKGGFPTRKALKYHLFRIHHQPMKKASQPQQHQRTQQDQDTVPLSPTVSTFPLVREGDTLLVDFPITGDVSCPELRCGRKFVCKSWSSVVWSVKKHLRIFHHLSAITTRLRCGSCHDDLVKPLKKHNCLHGLDHYSPHHSSQWRCEPCGLSFPSQLSLRNHLNGHKKSQLRDAAPKLSLPTTARRKTRRKRGNSGSPAFLDEPSVVTDGNTMLAPPVLQEPLAVSNASDAEDDPGPLSHLHEAFDCLLEGPPSGDYFDTFERYAQDFVQEAILHLFPEGSDRRVPSSSSSSPPNMDDGATCQRLYKRNRRRAVREIMGHAGERCKIPLLSLQTFFTECWEGGTSDPQLYSSSESPGRVELLDAEFSPKEVWSLLKKAENTAPGPDRLTYHHLRTVDPGARLLSKIFNLCVRFRRVPSSWKVSTTILIPKGGDPSDVANWRPIALSNTSYKIFTKCLASRLSAWCERYDTISF
ncbi:retrovirus-related Pol polyprotein from type-2 retrotransposable element R2DM [Caerostris darwini]|uniref:Retrovirus-related Pol polyprotein from type-2 retrotransposable element R2DM n=1 Tax=Caerostris darwini TaxID=1538125 RepID=A0AAV4S9F0_9ARAC|nr:retrovirus-related Pol polyprotein from type-2 retrotransposable element R2DM [Caerostris darwini]